MQCTGTQYSFSLLKTPYLQHLRIYGEWAFEHGVSSCNWDTYPQRYSLTV